MTLSQETPILCITNLVLVLDVELYLLDLKYPFYVAFRA